MKLVIDLPENDCNLICKAVNSEDYYHLLLTPVTYTLFAAVAKGKSLPDGCGKLYCERDILDFLQCEDFETCTWKNCSECNNASCITTNNLAKVMSIEENCDDRSTT